MLSMQMKLWCSLDFEMLCEKILSKVKKLYIFLRETLVLLPSQSNIYLLHLLLGKDRFTGSKIVLQ